MRWSVAGIVMVVALAACGVPPAVPSASTMTTTAPSRTADSPPPADPRLGAGVVAVISFSGGNSAESPFYDGVPHWIAYDDGTVIEAPPGAAWTSARTGHVDPQVLRSILDRFMASPGYSEPLRDDLAAAFVSDAGSVELVFRTAEGGVRSVGALAFGAEAWMGLPAGVMVGRTAFMAVLDELAGAAGDLRPWRPTAMLISARRSDTSTGFAGVSGWTGDPGLPARLAADGRCTTLTGADADRLVDASYGPYGLGDRTTPDGTFFVSIRPVLPGYPVC